MITQKKLYLELQDGVKAAGGQWNAQEKIWEIAYGEVRELGLTDYMMESSMSSIQNFPLVETFVRTPP